MHLVRCTRIDLYMSIDVSMMVMSAGGGRRVRAGLDLLPLDGQEAWLRPRRSVPRAGAAGVIESRCKVSPWLKLNMATETYHVEHAYVDVCRSCVKAYTLRTIKS